MRQQAAALPWEEVQLRDRCVMRVADDGVQPALLQVPDRGRASAPARRHKRACQHLQAHVPPLDAACTARDPALLAVTW